MSGAAAVSIGHAAIGGVSVLGGAVWSTRVTLSARARSLVQHAAAGTVFPPLFLTGIAIR